MEEDALHLLRDPFLGPARMLVAEIRRPEPAR